MKKITLITLAATILMTTGCTTSKDAMIPKPEQNMREVYAQHMGNGPAGNSFDERSVVRRPILEDEVNLSDYTRTESNQLSSRFKFLPNPVLVMYVAPHLATASEVPVPGYVTQFRMYERDHHALPHEDINVSNEDRLPN